MKTFVIGDIHGGYRSLMQCLERSRFDYGKDRLICLGDVADGWPETRLCFDELLKIKNLVYILGNHDAWFRNWMRTGDTPRIWTSQGGTNTLKSYEFKTNKDHLDLLEKAVMYFINEYNDLFVHGGYDWHFPIENQKDPSLEGMGEGHTLYNWDRHLFETACMWDRWNRVHPSSIFKFKDFNRIFVGHTSTSREEPSLAPLQLANVWALDQGGGWEGKLTIMEVDTENYWQSDVVRTLYPEGSAR